MNSANQTLQAIKQQKAILKQKYQQAQKRLEQKYNEDMAILNKEEKEILKQFNDIPPETYTEKEEEEE